MLINSCFKIKIIFPMVYPSTNPSTSYKIQIVKSFNVKPKKKKKSFNVFEERNVVSNPILKIWPQFINSWFEKRLGKMKLILLYQCGCSITLYKNKEFFFFIIIKDCYLFIKRLSKKI